MKLERLRNLPKIRVIGTYLSPSWFHISSAFTSLAHASTGCTALEPSLLNVSWMYASVLVQALAIYHLVQYAGFQWFLWLWSLFSLVQGCVILRVIFFSKTQSCLCHSYYVPLFLPGLCYLLTRVTSARWQTRKLQALVLPRKYQMNNDNIWTKVALWEV